MYAQILFYLFASVSFAVPLALRAQDAGMLPAFTLEKKNDSAVRQVRAEAEYETITYIRKRRA